MSVTITVIQPQDSLSGSRLTINSNFSALKAGIDASHLLLNPTTSILSGVKSAIINNNAVPFSTSIFQVGKGSSLLGNVIMGTTGASTTVLINGNGGISIPISSLTLGTGNLTLSSSSSLAKFSGNHSISGEQRLPGIAAGFAGPYVGMTQSTTLVITGLKYLILQNGTTAPGVGITVSLPAGTTGQVLEVFHLTGASGFPVTIIPASNQFYGLTGGIQMSQTGDTLRLIFDGTLWYLWNYSPASNGNWVGPTGSSITFTSV